LQRHKCRWRVADSRIAYGFNLALIALFSEDLMVSADLHIEVRKSVFGVFHKTYVKSATPTSYTYRPGQILMTAFDYLEHFKDINSDKELYEDKIAGSQAFYQLGKKLENQDLATALIWYCRAADSGNIAAMLRLGRLLENVESDVASMWYMRAADAGDSRAMLKLGEIAEDEGHRRQARFWYRKAAGAGNPRARQALMRVHPLRQFFRY
jgi:TPR repeat protein